MKRNPCLYIRESVDERTRARALNLKQQQFIQSTFQSTPITVHDNRVYVRSIAFYQQGVFVGSVWWNVIRNNNNNNNNWRSGTFPVR